MGEKLFLNILFYMVTDGHMMLKSNNVYLSAMLLMTLHTTLFFKVESLQCRSIRQQINYLISLFLQYIVILFKVLF